MTTQFKTSADPEVRNLWDAYWEDHDLKARNELVEHYLPFVRKIATRLHSKFYGHIELDDMISTGNIGLMRAIEAYDCSRGITFEAYSIHRVRGAILDAVREMDWVPREVRVRARSLLRATEKLSNLLNRKPTESELAEELQLAPKKFAATVRDSVGSSLVSFSSLNGSHSDDTGFCKVVLDAITDEHTPDVSDSVVNEELLNAIQAGLSDDERTIMHEYYYGGKTLKAIGELIGLSEARVSQKRTTLLAQLRDKFDVQTRPFKMKLVPAPSLDQRTAPTTTPRTRLLAA